MTDGADAELFAALAAEGVAYEVVAPTVAGVESSDGRVVEAKHRLGGGPSVLFDSIAILISEEGPGLLAKDSAARVFVADALDEGCVELRSADDADRFVEPCAAMRH